MRRWCPGSSTPMCTAARGGASFSGGPTDGDGGCPAPAAWHAPHWWPRRGLRESGRPAAPGHRTGRRGAGRGDRRHPSGRPVAGRRTLRRTRSGAVARSRTRGTTTGARRRRRDDPDGDAGPERSGALDAIATLVDANVAAAVGHTEATYAQTRAAIEATVATHLFNAMRPIHHREPGPVIALLEDPRVTVELITDGVHVDAALYRHVSRTAGADRVDLVTDAMAAAGMSDGAYRIGPLAVDVTDEHTWPVPRPSPAAPRRWTGCSGSPSPTANCRATKRCVRRCGSRRSIRPAHWVSPTRR